MYDPPINIFLPITSIFQQKRVFRTEGVSFFVFFREYWTRHGGGEARKWRNVSSPDRGENVNFFCTFSGVFVSH